jgi:hypothetical protein
MIPAGVLVQLSPLAPFRITSEARGAIVPLVTALRTRSSHKVRPTAKENAASGPSRGAPRSGPIIPWT